MFSREYASSQDFSISDSFVEIGYIFAIVVDDDVVDLGRLFLMQIRQAIGYLFFL